MQILNVKKIKMYKKYKMEWTNKAMIGIGIRTTESYSLVKGALSDLR